MSVIAGLCVSFVDFPFSFTRSYEWLLYSLSAGFKIIHDMRCFWYHYKLLLSSQSDCWSANYLNNHLESIKQKCCSQGAWSCTSLLVIANITTHQTHIVCRNDNVSTPVHGSQFEGTKTKVAVRKDSLFAIHLQSHQFPPYLWVKR